MIYRPSIYVSWKGECKIMYQVKWINYGIPGIIPSAEYEVMSDAMRHVTKLQDFTDQAVFAWIEPCHPEPEPSRLEWEDVMGQAPEPETRTITQETLAMLDSADKTPCPMNDAASDMSVLVGLLGDQFADDYTDYGSVDMVASGYEFMCHECGEITAVIEWSEIVQCQGCCCTFRANVPEHVYE
jgi:hypothetical protein